MRHLYGLLRVISLLVPTHQRGDWLQEWIGEFHHTWGEPGERQRSTLSAFVRCCGALGDALRLRMRQPRGANAPVVQTTWEDIRVGVRALRKRPGFAIVAISTLALGIGATTTIFSVVDHVLIRPLPYPEPQQLVSFAKGNSTIPVPDYLDIKDRSDAFESVGAVRDRSGDLTGSRTPEQINVGEVTGDFFYILGASPAVGRLLLAGDHNTDAARVVVLSHGLWQRRWGGDPNIVGRTVALDGESYEVVGVLAREFRAPEAFVQPVDVWITFDPTPFLQGRRMWVIWTVARLAPGVSIDAARAEMDRLARVLADEYPESNRNEAGDPYPFSLKTLQNKTVGSVGRPLFLLMGAVGLMLLIACANVANLFLARGTDRGREMVLRSALGAARGRIVRLLLTESLLVSFAGGALGVAIAVFGVKAFAIYNAGDLPRVAAVTVDWRVLVFTVFLSIVTGLLFGIAPALASANIDFQSALKDSALTTTAGRHRNRLRNALVITEICLASLLLVGAGLLFSSFLHLRGISPGFDPNNVLAFSVRLGSPLSGGTARYESRQSKEDLIRDLLMVANSAPEIYRAGASLALPFHRGSCCLGSSFVPEGTSADTTEMWLHPITPGYFDALGARLVAGRQLTEEDETVGIAASASIAEGTVALPAVISRSVARLFWGDASPLGHRLFGPPDNFRVYSVVGVVDDILHHGLDTQDMYHIYVPFYATRAAWYGFFDIAVRYRGTAEAAAAAFRQAVWSIDSDLPVIPPLTMKQRISRSITTPRFNSLVFGFFATVAFLLAAVGIYGSMSYVVGQRQRELGIRLALGGRSRDLQRLVLAKGALLTGTGLALGLAAALALSRLLEGFVFGITTTDPLTLATVCLLLGAVAMAACYVPARRASKADVLEVMRAE